MKPLLILLGVLSLHSVRAQVIDIGEWQKSHPQVIFIEQDVYDAFGEEQLNNINDHVIVYNSSVQIKDIEDYLASKSLSLHSSMFDYSDPNADVIKQWLGHNKQVTIVAAQKFNGLTSEGQTTLLQNGALILTEKYLTIEKISEYEANH
ncbi:MAG: hypothetical protein HRT58_02560 [Crocinitomicaceae bacterium]|nr:hypothetical protein [Flavobacteriales bacterium]NQZ34511.1 hypothetical protein [Crocinitomicaceae bacterium]